VAKSGRKRSSGEALGSWIEGPRAAAERQGIDLGYPGQQLGRPRSGPGSVVRFDGRLLAFVVDSLACALIAVGLLRDPAWVTPLFLLEVLIGTAVAGASFGQRVCRQRIVRVADSGAVDPLRALTRTALLALLVPALVWDRDGRGLHDRAAGTVLVRV
jgi:uncharacterized RDD family membrane protein YckC